MSRQVLREEIEALGSGVGARFNEPMSAHTSLGIGGPAEIFVVPEDQHLLVAALAAAKQCNAPVMAMGGGTNLLVRDEGIDGLVVQVGALDSLEMQVGDDGMVRVRAGAGVRLQKFMAYCRREGLAGLEALAGIPGMLGGAVAGNAGAYGTEIKDVIEEVEVVGLDGISRVVDVSEAGFRYRGSGLHEAGVVTALTMLLLKSEPSDVGARMDDFLKRKQCTQPIGKRSAGCVFKNPDGESAGRLMDSAGCKGMREGGIEVSEQHANFFINTGGGSSGDFLSLMDKIATRVSEVHGIELEPELKVVGRGLND